MEQANLHIKWNEASQKYVFAVGIYDENSNQYSAPLDAETRQATGCYAEYSRKPIGSMNLETAVKFARRHLGIVLPSDDAAKEIIKYYNSDLAYDEENLTWCLFGIDNGNAWESDDFKANSLEQAVLDAADYLIEENIG